MDKSLAQLLHEAYDIVGDAAGWTNDTPESYAWRERAKVWRSEAFRSQAHVREELDQSYAAYFPDLEPVADGKQRPYKEPDAELRQVPWSEDDELRELNEDELRELRELGEHGSAEWKIAPKTAPTVTHILTPAQAALLNEMREQGSENIVWSSDDHTLEDVQTAARALAYERITLAKWPGFVPTEEEAQPAQPDTADVLRGIQMQLQTLERKVEALRRV